MGETHPARLRISLKLFQKFTNKRAVTNADVDLFKRGIDPLAEADKLGALLCQFPASFKRDESSVDYLTWLLETFGN